MRKSRITNRPYRVGKVIVCCDCDGEFTTLSQRPGPRCPECHAKQKQTRERERERVKKRIPRYRWAALDALIEKYKIAKEQKRIADEKIDRALIAENALRPINIQHLTPERIVREWDQIIANL